jgi:hypothetical protein
MTVDDQASVPSPAGWSVGISKAAAVTSSTGTAGITAGILRDSG